MTKHTPGPWIIVCGTGAERSYTFITPETRHRKPIAQLVTTLDTFRNGEDRANARLIAKAPELLKILREIVGAAVQKEHLEVYLLHPQFIADAQAVIAKTEGR